MTIKIKLTNPEFEIIAAIHEGKQPPESKILWNLQDHDLVWKEVWNRKETIKLTTLGQLAWEQNKPRESKVEKPTDEAYRQCVAYWLKDFHLGWTFGAIHGVALKSILAKIRKAQPDSANATVVATFKKLCQSLPEWFKDKDLPVINSKFNEIITQIQRGPNKGGWNQQNSAERSFGGY